MSLYYLSNDVRDQLNAAISLHIQRPFHARAKPQTFEKWETGTGLQFNPLSVNPKDGQAHSNKLAFASFSAFSQVITV